MQLVLLLLLLLLLLPSAAQPGSSVCRAGGGLVVVTDLGASADGIALVDEKEEDGGARCGAAAESAVAAALGFRSGAGSAPAKAPLRTQRMHGLILRMPPPPPVTALTAVLDGGTTRSILCSLPLEPGSLRRPTAGDAAAHALTREAARAALEACVALDLGVSAPRASEMVSSSEKFVDGAVAAHAHWWARQRVLLALADVTGNRMRARAQLLSRVRAAAGAAAAAALDDVEDLLVLVVGAHSASLNDPVFGGSDPDDATAGQGEGFVGFLRPLLPPRPQGGVGDALLPGWRPVFVFVEPVPAVMENLMRNHAEQPAGELEARRRRAEAPATGAAPSLHAAFHSVFDYGARFLQLAVCEETRAAVPFYVAGTPPNRSLSRFADQLGSLSPQHLQRHGAAAEHHVALSVDCVTYRDLLARLAADRTLALPPAKARPDVLVVDAEGADLAIVAQVLDSAREAASVKAGSLRGTRLPLLLLFETVHAGTGSEAGSDEGEGEGEGDGEGEGGGGNADENEGEGTYQRSPRLPALLARLEAEGGYVCEKVSPADIACVRHGSWGTAE